MYAAGIAVMFVLFGATAASGVLLEEKENGTLERILASQLNLDQLLMGKWLYMTTIGCIQMVLMFTWGSLVHKLPLLGTLGRIRGHDHRLRWMFIQLCIVTGGCLSIKSSIELGLDRCHLIDECLGWQHGTKVFDERLDEADWLVHLQRLGAGRIQQSILARVAFERSLARTWGTDPIGLSVAGRSALSGNAMGTSLVGKLFYAEPACQLIKLTNISIATGMNMFGFGDEANVFIGIDIMFDQDLFEGFER